MLFRAQELPLQTLAVPHLSTTEVWVGTELSAPGSWFSMLKNWTCIGAGTVSQQLRKGLALQVLDCRHSQPAAGESPLALQVLDRERGVMLSGIADAGDVRVQPHPPHPPMAFAISQLSAEGSWRVWLKGRMHGK